MPCIPLAKLNSYWVYETEPYCEDQFKDWFEFNIFIELEDQIKK